MIMGWEQNKHKKKTRRKSIHKTKPASPHFYYVERYIFIPLLTDWLFKLVSRLLLLLFFLISAITIKVQYSTVQYRLLLIAYSTPHIYVCNNKSVNQSVFTYRNKFTKIFCNCSPHNTKLYLFNSEDVCWCVREQK